MTLDPEIVVRRRPRLHILEAVHATLETLSSEAPGHCAHPFVDLATKGLPDDKVRSAGQIRACVSINLSFKQALMRHLTWTFRGFSE